MQPLTDSRFTTLHFEHLPGFAAFILQQYLQEFSLHQLQLSRELQLPMLKQFDKISEAELVAITMESSRTFLEYLVQNKAGRQIEEAVEMWVNNRLPQIDKNEIAAEDIILAGLIRKKTFLHFLPHYCNQLPAALELIAEIDTFLTASESTLTNTYIKLLHNQIEEHSHFIQQINNTIPGALYVFDLLQYKGIYSNGKLKEVMGIDHQQLNALGTEVFKELIHPDDIRATQKSILRIHTLADGEINSYRFRIRQSDGQFRWIRIYESVFRRNAEGAVIETIAIALNVDKEKRTADQLAQREQQLLEAQEIAQTGSYIWHLQKKQLDGTPKLFELLAINKNDYKTVVEKIHPDDTQKLFTAFEESLKTGKFECEFHYLTDGSEKVFWSKAVINYAEDGTPSTLTGTLMDITDRNRILEHLRHSEKNYKLAESLAHIGNFEIDLSTNKIKMSDEMFRIYELPPQEGLIDYSLAMKMRHPDDELIVKEAIRQAIEEKKPCDIYFRIITNDGHFKIVRTRAEPVINSDGSAHKIIGTLQDVTEKQQLIEKLKQSEYMYKQAEEMANMGNYSMNVLTNDIEWTDQLYKIYGLEPQAEKITEERFYSFIHPEDRELVDNSIAAFYKEGYGDYTFRIITAAGEVKTLRSISQLQKDASGRPLLVIGTEQDVTEHRNLISNLEKSQWLSHQAQMIAHLGNWTFNLKTNEMYWSEELYRIYELAPTEKASYDLFVSLLHPDEKEEVIAYYEQCVREKKPYNKKHRVVLRNGKVKTLHRKGEIRLDAEGEVESFFGTTQDITEQQAAEMDLLEKQNFIQKIADATPTILYLYNVAENRFVYINREVYYVLGYTAEEVLNAGTGATRLLYNPEDYNLLPERAESSKKFQHADSMVQYECRMHKKNGDWCWVLVREVMFKTDESGNIVEILGAALDITKRKEMEKTLVQNAYQLAQSNASLEEFAYVASHDLKEPLRKISTFGDRLLHTQLDQLSDDGQTYLKKIVDASQRMQLMISDLLSISMITGDHAFEPFSLQAILDEVLQTLEYKIDQKGAVIHSDNLPTVHIIPSQFRQLFQNLLSNSLKFVSNDVQPQINITHTFLEPHEAEHLQLKKATRYLQLQFKDNGIGFDEEYAGKIFAIFQRLHGRSEYEGTGIGLAICKKIVEHHGGVIFATAQAQMGATFTIILPLM